MLLTPTTLRTYGLRIDAGIPDAVLQLHITNAQVLVEELLGMTTWAVVAQLQDVDVVLKGGTGSDGRTLLGLERSAAYIAYALLLHDNVFASTFGTTNKRDEYSTAADPTDVSRQWYAYGIKGVEQAAGELKQRGSITNDNLNHIDVPLVAEKPFDDNIFKGKSWR